jgi:CxxC-x17-CxxC domain-containing protein
VFTISEQEFFSGKGFNNDPSRCQDCRANRKARIAAQIASGSYEPTPSGYSSNGRREYTRATCASCGGEALLPFSPRGDRPVYCSDCFDKVRSYR